MTPDARRPRLLLAVWLMAVMAFLAVFALDLRLSYRLMEAPCDGEACHYQALTTAEATALAAMGLSMRAYTLYMHGLSAATVVVFVALALAMLRRLYPQGRGFLFSLMLVVMPTTAITSFDVIAATFPAWVVPMQLLFALGSALILQFFLVFPSGRIAPRWTPVIPVIFAIASASSLFNAALRENWVFIGSYVALLISLLAVVIYRYVRLFNPTERQQTKWVLLGMLVFLTGIPLWGYSFEFSSPAPGQAKLLTNVVGWTLCMASILALPGAIFVAILRYRLWDIDLLVRRTLIYSVLTGLLALVYLGSVVALQGLLRDVIGSEAQIASVLSTLLIAALFVPLRARVQRAIDRRFYRRKYDATHTLAGFAARARDETDLDRLSAQLVGVVEETMQPASVNLWLRGG